MLYFHRHFLHFHIILIIYNSFIELRLTDFATQHNKINHYHNFE